MAFKTFAPGVLTSSDVNTYLMRQAVITCTSSTRPSTPSEGMTIYETDTDYYMTYSGSAWETLSKSGAWTTYTPAIGNSGGGTNWSLGNGTAVGSYQKLGRLVIGWAYVAWGSTSTFGTNSLLVGLPLTPTTAASLEWTAGQCHARDVSTVNGYEGFGWLNTGSAFMSVGLFATSSTWATNETYINTRPFTWASGDYLTIQFIYEAAA